MLPIIKFIGDMVEIIVDTFDMILLFPIFNYFTLDGIISCGVYPEKRK